ncbi:hypothetical protein [Streptomyces mirabilis]|uniref:hypothetical protein n=1 Tax=Streptomyces mirabilis TaxID=68239 RepID=UPI0036933BEC
MVSSTYEAAEDGPAAIDSARTAGDPTRTACWEPQERRQMPVWLYAEERLAEEHRLGPAHDGLRSALSKSLAAITSEAYQ